MNKRAQISDTIMWIVATIAVVVILLISMFLTTVIGKTNFISFLGTEKETDLFISKSFFSFLLTKESGKIFFEEMREESETNKISDATKNIFDKIFSIHKKYYPYIWMSFTDNKGAISFGSWGYAPPGKIFSELIKLKENKYLALYFSK